jgi:hypothetical protein
MIIFVNAIVVLFRQNSLVFLSYLYRSGHWSTSLLLQIEWTFLTLVLLGRIFGRRQSPL